MKNEVMKIEKAITEIAEKAHAEKENALYALAYLEHLSHYAKNEATNLKMKAIELAEKYPFNEIPHDDFHIHKIKLSSKELADPITYSAHYTSRFNTKSAPLFDISIRISESSTSCFHCKQPNKKKSWLKKVFGNG